MSGFADPVEEEPHDEPEDLLTQTVILNKYCFWYHKRHQKIGASAYEENINQVASFQTIEHFWRVYDHLIRVNDVKSTTDFHLFKHGIKPTWEDPQNEKGGKWMIRLKKGLSSRYWEDIVLAIIGEQFDVGHEICGAVISVRAAEDILSVWNKNSDNLEAKNKIRDQMKKLLRLPTYVPLEYKVHNDSLKDGSSFRNTSVWRPSHAPRGASWNGPDAAADSSHGGYKSRSHMAQPPGGVQGDGTTWGGSGGSSRYTHHQQGNSWKHSNLSTDTSHSVQDGPSMISPIVSSLGEVAEKPSNFWGKPRDTGGSWGRTNSTTPTGGAGGGFQHKGPDDERGGNYGDAVEGRNQRVSRYNQPTTAPGVAGGVPSTYASRRRFEAPAPGQAAEGLVGAVEKKKIAPSANQSDQVRVWGRAQIVVADAVGDAGESM